MPTRIETKSHQFNYNLICIAKASYKLFLKSNNPEVKMLGILGSFGKEDRYNAIKSIVDQVKTFTKGEFAESRYFRQLCIFVQLRSTVEQEFNKAMETISQFFKEENDFLFRRGEVKGEVKGRHEKALDIARKMKKEGMSTINIERFTSLTIEEIEKL